MTYRNSLLFALAIAVLALVGIAFFWAIILISVMNGEGRTLIENSGKLTDAFISSSGDSNPLGMSGSWWTAIGTITALTIALGGAFVPMIWRWWCRPSISILFDRITEFSSVDGQGDAYWLRVPISNASGKREAKDVEVFIENFSRILPNGDLERIERSTAMRLVWCHTMEPRCSSIPSDGFRLLHMGMVELKPPTQIVGRVLKASIQSFRLGGEVPLKAHDPAAYGTFALTLNLSCKGQPMQQYRMRISIQLPFRKVVLPAKIEEIR